MKLHTTNYFNTFIQIAEDCPVGTGEIPASRGVDKTAAEIQFEMISRNPYVYTSDEVLFEVFAIKKDISEAEKEAVRLEFFSKGQPCLRASPLTKRYGWGIHFDREGRIAVYEAGSSDYDRLSKDPSLKVLRAMKSKR